MHKYTIFYFLNMPPDYLTMILFIGPKCFLLCIGIKYISSGEIVACDFFLFRLIRKKELIPS